MRTVEIRYTSEAIKFLKKQEKKTVERIHEAIAKLTLHPPEGDIIAMKGFSDERKRLRVGSWRVVFRYTKDRKIEVLLVMNIGYRGDVYKK